MLPTLALVAIALSPTPSGSQILKQCQAAYDAVKTLDENVTGQIDNMKGTAHIQFRRPGLLHISGTSLFNTPYELICDGRKTWVLNSGSWSEAQSPEMGIATLTGVSANAATAVPSALFHTSWGSFSQQGNPDKTSTVNLGSRRAYRLDFSKPMARKVWIDASTHFILKTEMTAMEKTIVVKFGLPVVNRSIPSSAFRH